MTDRWATILDRPEFLLGRDAVAEALTGRSVMITGAAGSVGSALSELVCASAPRSAILFDSHEASLFWLGRRLDTAFGQTDRRLVLGDVRDRRKLDQIVRRFRPDLIFHLAAYKHVPLAEDNLDQLLGVNVVGAFHVVEAASENGVGAVIYPSTDKAVRPHAIYGATKRIVERVFQARALADQSLRLRLVRLVNVFGTQGSVAEIFSRQIAADQPISITDLGMDRYWMTMHEATQLLVAASGRPSFEGIHLVDVGEPVPLAVTAKRIFEMLRPNQSGPTITVTGIRPGERLHEQLAYPDEIRTSTELERFLTLKLPSPTTSDSTWSEALRELVAGLYDLDATELRSWLWHAATVASVAGPTEFDPPRSDQEA